MRTYTASREETLTMEGQRKKGEGMTEAGRSISEEKTGEYLRILVCVSSLQLMWSQEDSLALFCSKTKPGLMRVSVISDWLSMGLLGAGCRDREEEKGQLD